MKNFWAPISFRGRDKRVADLIRKGSVTDDELFAAQYKDWPAKGLVRKEERTNIVNFRGFYGDTKAGWLSAVGNTLTTAAYVREEEPDRTIYVNRLLLGTGPFGNISSLLASRMVFARIHDVIDILMPEMRLYGYGFLAASLLLSSYKYAAASSIAKVVAPSLADEIGQEHIHTLEKDYNGRISQASFRANARDMIRNSGALKSTTTYVLQTIDMLLTWMPRDYFAADHELQARLHNVMVRGYDAWGKIPANEQELYAALADMGIKAPAEVKDWIYGKNQEVSDLREDFFRHASFITAITSPPNAEMNIGLNSYRSKDTLRYYWEECLPLLYADLLVKYGDTDAFEKFGYGGPKDILGLPGRTEKPSSGNASLPDLRR